MVEEATDLFLSFFSVGEIQKGCEDALFRVKDESSVILFCKKKWWPFKFKVFLLTCCQKTYIKKPLRLVPFMAGFPVLALSRPKKKNPADFCPIKVWSSNQWPPKLVWVPWFHPPTWDDLSRFDPSLGTSWNVSLAQAELQQDRKRSETHCSDLVKTGDAPPCRSGAGLMCPPRRARSCFVTFSCRASRRISSGKAPARRPQPPSSPIRR